MRIVLVIHLRPLTAAPRLLAMGAAGTDSAGLAYPGIGVAHWTVETPSGSFMRRLKGRVSAPTGTDMRTARGIASVVAGLVASVMFVTAANMALRLTMPGHAEAEAPMNFTLALPGGRLVSRANPVARRGVS